MFESPVRFIDNSENRMVIEYDAEYCEDKFMTPVDSNATDKILAHLELDISWSVKKLEYTGESYIITIEKLWV